MKVKLHRSAEKYLNRLQLADRDRFDDAFEDLEKERVSMAALALRKKLHGFIETMPERNLVIIKPLLAVLSEPLYTIEPATPEETRKAEKRIKEYEKDPSSFVSWKRKQKQKALQISTAAMI